MSIVFRSRRRTFSSILGVTLAITFIAGTFIAIDSTTRSTFEAFLSSFNGEFSISTSQANVTQVKDAVYNVSHVKNLALYQRVPIEGIETPDSDQLRWISIYGVEPENPPSWCKGQDITGSQDIPRGSIRLVGNVAEMLDVGVGDTVRLNSSYYDDYYHNASYRLLNLTVSSIATLSESWGDPWGPVYYSSLLVDIEDVGWIFEQFNITRFDQILYGEVYVHRDRVLNPYDIEDTRKSLIRLGRDLENALQPYHGYVSDNISRYLTNFYYVTIFQRLIFLVLSIPVLLLGIYLSIVGVELGHAESRRELAILKTRGAKERHVVTILMVEAAVGAIIAALIGLPLGLVLSRFLIGSVGTLSVPTSIRYEDVVLSFDTILTVILLSLIFMAAVSYRSAKRTAKLPIVEALKYYTPGETQIKYRPNTDIYLIVFSIIVYSIVIYGRYYSDNLVIFIIGSIFTVLIPIIPILMIIGTTRLLTRATGRVYEWSSKVCKPLAKNLYYVISRNLKRNPRRSANVALIISLGLGFGVFMFAILGSHTVYQQRQIRTTVGADVLVNTFMPNVSAFRENLTTVSEISAVTFTQVSMMQTTYDVLPVVIVEPETYFSAIQPEWWYFDGIDEEGARSILGTEGQVLVTSAYMNYMALEIGDRMTITARFYSETLFATKEVNVTIGGAVRFLPGPTRSVYEYLPSYAVYVGYDTILPILNPPPGFYSSNPPREGFYIDLVDGSDWRTAKEKIENAGATELTVYGEEVEKMSADPAFASVLGFINVEIAYTIVILTAGLGLILFAATIERDVEFAAIRARGASAKQAAGLLLSEAVSIMLIGIIVGTVVGLITSFMTMQILFVSPTPTPSFESIVPLTFELPLEFLLLIIIAPLAMFLTSLLVSWRTARMNIAKVLKLRGG